MEIKYKRANGSQKSAVWSLPCKVSLGMFSSEWLVSVEIPDARSIQTFVNKSSVIAQNEPTSDTKVDGRVRVSLVEVDPKTKSVLVDLPESTRVRVPVSLVQQQ